MTRIATAMAALLMGAAMPMAAQAAQPAAASATACNEACLEGVMTSYLDALGRRDPKAAPFAANARTTENEQLVAPGDGLWGTIGGYSGYRHVFADPRTGEVAAFVAIEEQGSPALLTVRLKVAGQRITQAEMLVARSQGPGSFLNTKLGAVKPIFLEKLPADKRLSREELIRRTNLYFDAIVKGNGNIAPFHALCNRTENGIQTTNNPDLQVPGASKDQPSNPAGCRDQISSGIFSYITEVNPRRYLLVDESRGLVFGMFMFRHAGRVTSVNVPGRGEVKMFPAAMKPFNVEVSELFKIADGQIREIEAVMVELPYRTPSAWAGQEKK